MESNLDGDLDNDRKKVTIACDSCRRRKVRCDGNSPCINCHRAGSQCSFSESLQKRPRGPPKGFVALIEDRLHTIERILINIAANPTTNQSSTSIVDDNVDAVNKLKRSFSLYSRQDTQNFAENNDGLIPPKSAPLPSYLSVKSEQGPLSAPLLSTNQVLNIPSKTRFIEDYNRQEKELRNALANLSFGSPQSSLPLIQTTPSNSPNLPSTLPHLPLPPPDIIQFLVHSYFTHANWTFPILRRSAYLEELCGNNDNNSSHTTSPLLLYSILAFGAMIAQITGAPAINSGYNSVFFSEKFQLSLNYFLDEPRLSTIQALMLMSLVETGTNTFRQTHYIHLAIRMAYSIHLHRNPNSSISETEQQDRRITFWSLFILDRQLALTTGEPMGIDENLCDISFPLTEGSNMEEMDPALHANVNYIPRSAQIETLRSYASLARIMGNIISHLQSNVIHPNLSTWSHYRIINMFEQALSAWRKDLPEYLSFNSDTFISPKSGFSQNSSGKSSESSPTTPNLIFPIHSPNLASSIHATYYTLFIMLHMPCLYTCQKRANRQYIFSLNCCCSSAKIITQIAEKLTSKSTPSFIFRQVYFGLIQAAKIHAISLSSIERSLRAPGYTNLKLCLELFNRYISFGIFIPSAQNQINMYKSHLDSKSIEVEGTLSNANLNTYSMSSLLDDPQLDGNQNSFLSNLIPSSQRMQSQNLLNLSTSANSNSNRLSNIKIEHSLNSPLVHHSGMDNWNFTSPSTGQSAFNPSQNGQNGQNSDLMSPTTASFMSLLNDKNILFQN